MSDPNSETTTVDAARMTTVGLWRAAVCVDGNGRESFWLLSPEPTGEPGCACRTCAPHEQLSPSRRTR